MPKAEPLSVDVDTQPGIPLHPQHASSAPPSGGGTHGGGGPSRRCTVPTPTHTHQQRLGRGHGTLEKRHWDEPAQRTVMAAGYEVAQSRQQWKDLEGECIRRVTRTQREMRVPVGHWMLVVAEKVTSQHTGAQREPRGSAAGDQNNCWCEVDAVLAPPNWAHFGQLGAISTEADGFSDSFSTSRVSLQASGPEGAGAGPSRKSVCSRLRGPHQSGRNLGVEPGKTLSVSGGKQGYTFGGPPVLRISCMFETSHREDDRLGGDGSCGADRLCSRVRLCSQLEVVA